MTLADKIRPHVMAIKQAEKRGDTGAKQIIDLYAMHCSAPNDPGARALCEVAFDEWIARNAHR